MKALCARPRAAEAVRITGVPTRRRGIDVAAASGGVTTIGAAILLATIGGPAGLVDVLVAVAVMVTLWAARRDMLDLVSGLTLLLARPYAPGERIRLALPGSRAPIDGEVLRVGLLRTHVCTRTGLVVLPNRRLLRTA